MHWRLITAAGSAALLTGLAACDGGSGPKANEPKPSPRLDKLDDIVIPQESQPFNSDAQNGGEVSVLSVGGLTTLDPTEANYANARSILSGLVVRSLTQYIYDAESEHMVLVPDLATDLGAPNAEFTEWTYTLRDGIKYEDGSLVTPQDVKFGILRSFDRDTFPDGAAYSNEYFLNGDKYKGPYSDPQGDCDCVEIDGMDITIKMARPFPDMPYWGAFPAISPIPEAKAKDPQAYARHPLSTGPYKFGTYKQGDTLQLVRNDQWDLTTDVGRHAYPNSYRMDFNRSSVTIDQTILADRGKAQTTLTYDNVLPRDLTDARESGRLVTGGAPCTYFWYPDLRKPEWQDLNVRKALGYAYPYAKAWRAVREIVGVTRIPGMTIQPPGIPSRPEPYDILGNGGLRSQTVAAHDLLEQADALDTEVSFLYVTSDRLSVELKNIYVKSLTAAGFGPKPVAVADDLLTVELRVDPEAPVNLHSGVWCSDWPSGALWIPPLFRTGGEANYGHFSEKSVDEQIRKIPTAHLDEQPDLWAALDKRIVEQYYPLVNRGHAGVAFLHGSAVHGMNNDDVLGMPTWKDIWVED